MKKRTILSLVLALVLAFGTCAASAAEFKTFGEAPITFYGEGINGEGYLEWMQYMYPDIDFSALTYTDLDPFVDNGLFGSLKELTYEEWEKATDKTNTALFPYNHKWEYDKDSAFNDGIQYVYAENIDPETGAYDPESSESRGDFRDVSGRTIFSTLTYGWSRTWTYNCYYNLGYMTESALEFDLDFETYETTGLNYQYSAVTNVVTGDVYRFNNILIDSIDNNGNIYFSSYDNKAEAQRFFTAKLTLPAIITVYLNGQKIAFDQIPVIENDRTLVPLRAIFEAMGAQIQWDNPTQTVTAVKGDTTIQLTIDKTEATKNGETIYLDAPATIENGRTLVPVRFIADCFGVSTEWDNDLRRVLLTSN